MSNKFVLFFEDTLAPDLEQALGQLALGKLTGNPSSPGALAGSAALSIAETATALQAQGHAVTLKSVSQADAANLGAIVAKSSTSTLAQVAGAVVSAYGAAAAGISEPAPVAMPVLTPAQTALAALAPVVADIAGKSSPVADIAAAAAATVPATPEAAASNAAEVHQAIGAAVADAPGLLEQLFPGASADIQKVQQLLANL